MFELYVLFYTLGTYIQVALERENIMMDLQAMVFYRFLGHTT